MGIAQNESEPTSFSPRWRAINKWHPVSDYAKTPTSGNELGLGLPVPFEHLAQSFECDALSQSPLNPSWSGESFSDPLSPQEIHYRTNEIVPAMESRPLLPRPQSKLYAHCLVRSTQSVTSRGSNASDRMAASSNSDGNPSDSDDNPFCRSPVFIASWTRSEHWQGGGLTRR